MTRRELKGVVDYRKGQRCGLGLTGNLVMNSPIIRAAVSLMHYTLCWPLPWLI